MSVAYFGVSCHIIHKIHARDMTACHVYITFNTCTTLDCSQVSQGHGAVKTILKFLIRNKHCLVQGQLIWII